MSEKEKLINEIKRLSDSIRAKNRALKHDISERAKYLEDTFKPVVGPLKDIKHKLEKPATDGDELMPVSKIEKMETEDDENIETDTNVNETEDETDVEEFIPTSLGEELLSSESIGKRYLMNMISIPPTKRKTHSYGARVENGVAMIGNSPFEIDEQNNIVIKGVKYKGTPGLFELIFKNIPLRKYSLKDLDTYKIILKATNAHKKQYSPYLPVHRSTSKKYVNIISHLFPVKKIMSQPSTPSGYKGHGMALKDSYETNVIYYNDVNKIVKRMQLLYEAKDSGHTGVNNEIVALTEELRNKGYII